MLNDVDAPVFQALDRGEASVAEPFFKPEAREERSLGDFLDSRGVGRRREEKAVASAATAREEFYRNNPRGTIDFGGSFAPLSSPQSDVSNPFAKPKSKAIRQLPETNDARTGFAPIIKPLEKFKPLFTR